ncbi:MAG: hypothetical protein NC339_03880 [Muribaculaceae bacterium]|nr:hypothetical protein [Muribaculaceae bacterium]
METKRIPPKAIDALERAISGAVQQRIDDDPDVADAYLRIGIHEKSFTVMTMYIEESNASQPNRDVALLDLMLDLKDNVGSGTEDWVPDHAAIRKLAESYSELIELDFCLN